MAKSSDSPQDSTQDAWKVPETLLTGAADPPGWGQSFMDRLSDADLIALAPRVQREQYPRGSVLFREGEPSDALYIVRFGRLAVLKGESDSYSTLLAYHGPGEIVGEMGVVSERPRSASVIAIEDTELFCVKRDDFRSLLIEHPGINRAILDVLSDRLRAADTVRTTIIREEETLSRRLERLTTEADRLAELIRLRQETIDLIVHDLRSPLSVIATCLRMLRLMQPEEVPASATEFLNIAQRSTERLLHLVEELLEAARQEQAGMPLARQALDLPQLLQAAVNSARTVAEENEITLDLEWQPDLPPLQGDATQLERVMTNLLDNATAFTPVGGRIVVAAATREGEVEVSVTDTGPGVPPDQREYIFERFTRASGLKGRRRGFGLGLHFCRQIVKAHGGRIWVEPGPENVGSRFAFTLPIDGEGEDD
jgi:signal transduction histidine kinase